MSKPRPSRAKLPTTTLTANGVTRTYADWADPDGYKPRYTLHKATFFQTRDRVAPMGIRSVVDWARTAHGGHQNLLFQPPPTGGCMRWGMCEPPTPEPTEPPEPRSAK